MKYYHNKHVLETFSYDPKGLGKMIGMSDEQVLEYFQKPFPQN